MGFNLLQSVLGQGNNATDPNALIKTILAAATPPEPDQPEPDAGTDPGAGGDMGLGGLNPGTPGFADVASAGTDAATPSASPIPAILGTPANDPSRAPWAPSTPPGTPPSLNEALPPGVIKEVLANPGLYKNLNSVLNQTQSKVPKMRPLDYLIAAGTPIASALLQMMTSRKRSDRAGNFAAGLASGGLQSLIGIAGRPAAAAQAQRQADIENMLLLHTLRGKPQASIDSATGKPTWAFETGETMGTAGPVPRPGARGTVETKEVTDESGDTHQIERDPTQKDWQPSMMDEPTPATSFNKQGIDMPASTLRVPVVSKKQPKEPKTEVGWGSTDPNAEKGDTEEMMLAQPGKKPVHLGIFRPTAGRTESKAEAEKRQVSHLAVLALQDAHARAKPNAKPEDIVNDATEDFRKKSNQSPVLADRANAVSSAIRNIGRNVTDKNQLGEILEKLTEGQGK